MIKYIAFAAFALALATSAQAMPRVPLHQPDGMSTKSVTAALALPVAMAGIGTTATGIGATATAAIGTTAITMAIGPTATMAIGTTATGTRTATGPTAMESPVELLAAISAEESSGSDTPTELSREGLGTPTFPAQCVS